MKKSNPKQRSIEWFGRQDIYGFLYRSWVKNRGVPNEMFDGRPVIGICNTWSELTPCNTHFRVLADHVRHGVLDAGGFPLEFPVMSLGETLMRPTAMLYRNLASMDVEESIRANPLDGVVLLAGCDKTTPATLMGACSVDLPTILVSGGPMLSGKYHGNDIGSGTNTWSMSEDLRAGKITVDEFHEAESCMHRSHGRPAHRRAGEGKGFPFQDSRPGGVRECDPRLGGHRRIDQCGDPSDRSRASHRRPSGPRRLRPARPRRAYARQSDALGQISHGGLLLRRRPAGGAAGAGRKRPPAARRAHGQRQDDLGEQQGRAVLEPRRHPRLQIAIQERRRHCGAARQPLP